MSEAAAVEVDRLIPFWRKIKFVLVDALIWQIGNENSWQRLNSVPAKNSEEWLWSGLDLAHIQVWSDFVSQKTTAYYKLLTLLHMYM